eukprot:534089_1
MSACKWQKTDTAYLIAIKYADQVTKSIVFGFMRSIEVMYGTNIPSEIVLICLMYYYNPEYFTKHGNHMILQHNNQTVKHDNKPYKHDDDDDDEYSWLDFYDAANTVYGNVEISECKYIKCIWHFKIKKFIAGVNIAIGIASSDKKETDGS